MGDIIKNIKEFIWDIVGYLIPGFFLIIILNFILSPQIAIENDFLIDWNELGEFLLLVVSYVLGYIVYSLTIFKINVQDQILKKLIKWFPKKQSYLSTFLSTGCESNFKKSATFKNSVEFLSDNGHKEAKNMRINEIRNILMSRDPSITQKVYTFMFRSSLFDHISTILIVVQLIVLFQIVFSFFDVFFLKVSNQFIVIYILFMLFIPLLGKCKRIFFPRAMRIPFSNLK